MGEPIFQARAGWDDDGGNSGGDGDADADDMAVAALAVMGAAAVDLNMIVDPHIHA